jgi:hypothetical protein
LGGISVIVSLPILCISRKLGADCHFLVVEQTVLLASVVHRYEFALPCENWVPEWFEAFNLSPGPMPTKLWRRFEDGE